MKIISQEAFEIQQQEDMVLDYCTPMTTDTTDLYNAFYDWFAPTCAEIGTLVGKENWRGGYEHMQDLWLYILQIDTSTEEGKNQMFTAQALATKWSAANEYCNHESNKLGWKPSRWWKWCWEQYDSGVQSTSDEAEDTQEAAE